jgi:hypothetical protein
LELILTGLLMFIILNVSTGPIETGIMAGIAVGGVIGLEALFAGPISGASMNPLRSLAGPWPPAPWICMDLPRLSRSSVPPYRFPAGWSPAYRETFLAFLKEPFMSQMLESCAKHVQQRPRRREGHC